MIESLVMGGSIGLLILGMHLLMADAGLQAQLLAFVAAAIIVGAVQILLTMWRKRHGSTTADQHDRQDSNLLQLRRNRRNPFFRELTSDWTGLDEHSGEPTSDGAGPQTHAGEPPQQQRP